ncbi:MAG: NotI family restriction endonuclease [Chloroflexi bacterium]|nr:NotI family restriction endonuclease [Chloroflexota bacterium]
MTQPRRFGIGEWYGHSFVGLTRDERLAYAAGPGSQPCPFRMGGGSCTKTGGVCSFRSYEDHDGVAVPASDAESGLRVLCPRRFEENMMIFQWVGEVVLGTATPAIATEVGFLKAEDGNTHVGRIDMVLANQESGIGALNWCALEIQAVYFSGRSMSEEFRNIRNYEGEQPPFPGQIRRPDYRSSGPKRLMPQLQIKVPTLRRWGKKMAVVVDKHFYDSLGRMEEVGDLSSGDIAWFTVDFVEEDHPGRRFKLVRDKVHVTTLERATEGLAEGPPVTLTEFEEGIRSKLVGR